MLTVDLGADDRRAARDRVPVAGPAVVRSHGRRLPDRGGSALKIPSHSSEITDAWLRAVLAPAWPEAGELRVRDVVRIGESFGFTGDVARVTLAWPSRGDDGGGAPSACDGWPPGSVVVKGWPTSAGHREPFALRLLGGAGVAGVPRLFAHAVDEEDGRAVVVLEDVGAAAEQGDCIQGLDAGRALLLTSALARAHAAFWGAEALAGEPWVTDVSVIRREPDWFHARRERYLERRRGRVDADLLALLAHADALLARANDVLSGAPPTLVHGDFHLDNVLFDAGGSPWILDWNSAARGPGVLDLVEIVVHVAPVEAREAVIDQYLGALSEGGARSGVRVDREELLVWLDAAFLRAVVTGTLGLANWEPEGVPRAARIFEAVGRRLTRAVAWWRRWRPGALGGWL